MDGYIEGRAHKYIVDISIYICNSCMYSYTSNTHHTSPTGRVAKSHSETPAPEARVGFFWSISGSQETKGFSPTIVGISLSWNFTSYFTNVA